MVDLFIKKKGIVLNVKRERWMLIISVAICIPLWMCI